MTLSDGYRRGAIGGLLAVGLIALLALLGSGCAALGSESDRVEDTLEEDVPEELQLRSLINRPSAIPSSQFPVVEQTEVPSVDKVDCPDEIPEQGEFKCVARDSSGDQTGQITAELINGGDDVQWSFEAGTAENFATAPESETPPPPLAVTPAAYERGKPSFGLVHNVVLSDPLMRGCRGRVETFQRGIDPLPGEAEPLDAIELHCEGEYWRVRYFRYRNAADMRTTSLDLDATTTVVNRGVLVVLWDPDADDDAFEPDPARKRAWDRIAKEITEKCDCGRWQRGWPKGVG